MKNELCFLNELDFTDKLDNGCLEKLVKVEKMMVRDFKDYNIPKMTHALNIIDEIQLSSVTNDLDYRLERIDFLRSNVFYLKSFKLLVDTNKEHENNADNKPVFEH